MERSRFILCLEGDHCLVFVFISQIVKLLWVISASGGARGKHCPVCRSAVCVQVQVVWCTAEGGWENFRLYHHSYQTELWNPIVKQGYLCLNHLQIVLLSVFEELLCGWCWVTVHYLSQITGRKEMRLRETNTPQAKIFSINLNWSGLATRTCFVCVWAHTHWCSGDKKGSDLDSEKEFSTNS